MFNGTVFAEGDFDVLQGRVEKEESPSVSGPMELFELLEVVVRSWPLKEQLAIKDSGGDRSLVEAVDVDVSDVASWS
ncbi:hypothetical protein OC861_006904, partial [Tilletia horrida]